MLFNFSQAWSQRGLRSSVGWWWRFCWIWHQLICVW